MTIFEGSRYAEAPVIRTLGSDGKTRPTIYAMTNAGAPYRASYRTYVVTAGERFDTIATLMWDDPELWWRIADLNPEVLYPGEIPAGTTVRIPL